MHLAWWWFPAGDDIALIVAIAGVTAGNMWQLFVKFRGSRGSTTVALGAAGGRAVDAAGAFRTVADGNLDLAAQHARDPECFTPRFPSCLGSCRARGRLPSAVPSSPRC